ncbi:50S ribosomal protein L15 [candidate division TA06 bacterium]|uniref:Large ribosomal subunit protein uL15 n=1 Tax=candidate division TA06 bacterium TaxID=2250710 RepID=A0A523UWV1_UNCT6|nr:MAG: 50S ribosomal protein L15 [candidate division TA06 bacterium]
MNLSEISPPKGARKKRKRVGCGPGSGHGKTATRGHKGQKSRSGSKARPWFEGGQMPFQRRVPKRGFTPIEKKVYQVVNLKDLEKSFEPDSEVGPRVLAERGLIRKARLPVKVLAKGDIKKVLTVTADSFSKSAKAKIEAAGGKVRVR